MRTTPYRMHRRRISGVLLALLAGILANLSTLLADECREQVTGQIRLEPHHPWRPPFDLERLGQSFVAVVELQSEERPLREYWLVSYLQGQELERKIVALAGIFAKPPFIGKASFTQPFDELALFAKCKFEGTPIEIVRQRVQLPEFEAEVVARPERLINPVDLGTILPSARLVAARRRPEVQCRAGSDFLSKGEAEYPNPGLVRVGLKD